MLSLRIRPLLDFRDEIERLRGQLDNLYSTGRGGFPVFDRTAFPAFNGWEDQDSFYVEAELPGLTLEDVEIVMTDATTLTIKGERKPPMLSENGWRRRERGYGPFERSMELPGPIDPDHVEATLKHGVLTIKLPKAPQIKPRKIEVKSA